MASIDLKTEGMHCMMCEKRIREHLMEVPGVTEARADHEAGMTHVEFDPEQASVAELVFAVGEAGYKAEMPG
jgi:copper chaperone CopZ